MNVTVGRQTAMNKGPITVATAQGRISADVRANGREIRDLMRQARSGGASLAHFPEGALSGCTKSQIKDWVQMDWAALGDELRQTAALAGKLGLWVVFGCAHRLTPPHRPHNSLYVVSDRGELVNRYDKRFLSHTEVTRFYTPGRGACLFEVGGWRFGCALCIEIQFDEVFRAYADRGVDCVLFSSYSQDPMFGTQAQGYAASHNLWISFSVPAQCSHTLGSRLIGPSGEVQGSMQLTSGVLVETLDADDRRWDVALNRSKPWRSLARKGDIYRERYADDPRSTDRSGF
jgi:predicted amidohydrolase